MQGFRKRSEDGEFMNTNELITACRQRGILMTADGEALRVDGLEFSNSTPGCLGVRRSWRPRVSLQPTLATLDTHGSRCER